MNLFKRKTKRADPASIQAVVKGNTQFALDLYHRLCDMKGNLFFSPYSLSTALAMTHAGARGETQAQMSLALHFPGGEVLHPAFASLEAKLEQAGKKGHVKLSIANTLWPRKGYKLLKEYLSLVKEMYGVRITPVDFEDESAARRQINTWVEEKTESKIKDLIPEGVLDDLTRLVLVNAIYFKGTWTEPFDEALTNEAPFLTAPGAQVQAQMMTRKHTFRYGETSDLQILELPYGEKDLSMLVLLPREIDGLGKLEGSLAMENLEVWLGDLKETEVEVSLPRLPSRCGWMNP